MIEFSGMEPIGLLPDRLGVAEFEPNEMDKILGSDVLGHEFAADNYNWTAAYLVEEVGLYEEEVAEWFKSNARGLGGKMPIDIWNGKDGFVKVFDYARQYKYLVDEALEGTDVLDADPMETSHALADRALGTILKGFTLAGVNLNSDGDPDYWGCEAISNPKKDSLHARWKRSGNGEDFRVTLHDGPRTATYYIVRLALSGQPMRVFQSGIVEYVDGKQQMTNSDSDINGRAPSAGEVAGFVVPFANEIKNGSLAIMPKATAIKNNL